MFAQVILSVLIPEHKRPQRNPEMQPGVVQAVCCYCLRPLPKSLKDLKENVATTAKHASIGVQHQHHPNNKSSLSQNVSVSALKVDILDFILILFFYFTLTIFF